MMWMMMMDIVRTLIVGHWSSLCIPPPSRYDNSSTTPTTTKRLPYSSSFLSLYIVVLQNTDPSTTLLLLVLLQSYDHHDVIWWVGSLSRRVVASRVSPDSTRTIDNVAMTLQYSISTAFDSSGAYSRLSRTVIGFWRRPAKHVCVWLYAPTGVWYLWMWMDTRHYEDGHSYVVERFTSTVQYCTVPGTTLATVLYRYCTVQYKYCTVL